VFVGNLSAGASKKDLLEVFRTAGSIQKIWLRNAGETKGQKAQTTHGFLLFDSQESAENAAKLNGTALKKHRVRVIIPKNHQVKKISIFLMKIIGSMEIVQQATCSDCQGSQCQDN
jgi:RNA recognition motif-containing protein